MPEFPVHFSLFLTINAKLLQVTKADVLSNVAMYDFCGLLEQMKPDECLS